MDKANKHPPLFITCRILRFCADLCEWQLQELGEDSQNKCTVTNGLLFTSCTLATLAIDIETRALMPLLLDLSETARRKQGIEDLADVTCLLELPARLRSVATFLQAEEKPLFYWAALIVIQRTERELDDLLRIPPYRGHSA